MNDEPKDNWGTYTSIVEDDLDAEWKETQRHINQMVALMHMIKDSSLQSAPWVAPPEPDTSRGAKLRNRPCLDDE